MSQQIRVIVSHHQQSELRAWLTMTVTERADGNIGHDVDIARAIRATGSGLELPASHLQVLRSEIAAGILTAAKQARKHSQAGWNITLDRIGGEDGDAVTLSSLPSIGFAVAATLAVLHGTGAEDLEREPHGGHGWNLTEIEATSF
ncbi:MAG: hypothetical protein PF961_10105 [Planctomycetota bacterium]|nr:hypothetical protein [Planctomycetota bacterium]